MQGAGANTGTVDRTAGGAFDAAHAAVTRDATLQFEVAAMPPPPPPPGWLEGVVKALQALGPAFEVIFWIGAALIVLAILWLIVREIIRIRWPERRKVAVPDAVEWRPAQADAVALLSDADALAAQGRFAEAVHLILLRSISDIDGRLPNLVRPALTARDIGSLRRLPVSARPAFARIAAVVEASLFGGAPVDEAAFRSCRQTYEAFALPDAWRAA